MDRSFPDLLSLSKSISVVYLGSKYFQQKIMNFLSISAADGRYQGAENGIFYDADLKNAVRHDMFSKRFIETDTWDQGN